VYRFFSSLLELLSARLMEAKEELGGNCMRNSDPDHSCRRMHEPLSLDLFIVCTPCPPFSTWRSERHSSNPRKHPQFKVTFGETGSAVSSLELHQPHRAIGEQVKGFGMRFSTWDDTTGLEKLESHVLSIKRSDGTLHFDVFSPLSAFGTSTVSVCGTKPL
jgi:hypothetical protein